MGFTNVIHAETLHLLEFIVTISEQVPGWRLDDAYLPLNFLFLFGVGLLIVFIVGVDLVFDRGRVNSTVQIWLGFILRNDKNR